MLKFFSGYFLAQFSAQNVFPAPGSPTSIKNSQSDFDFGATGPRTSPSLTSSWPIGTNPEKRLQFKANFILLCQINFYLPKIFFLYCHFKILMNSQKSAQLFKSNSPFTLALMYCFEIGNLQVITAFDIFYLPGKIGLMGCGS